jgi:hypothetical protein
MYLAESAMVRYRIVGMYGIVISPMDSGQLRNIILIPETHPTLMQKDQVSAVFKVVLSCNKLDRPGCPLSITQRIISKPGGEDRFFFYHDPTAWLRDDHTRRYQVWEYKYKNTLVIARHSSVVNPLFHLNMVDNDFGRLM